MSEMEEPLNQIDVISRIVTLEIRLTNTIDKLDHLIDVVERRHSDLYERYEGSGIHPSILSRLQLLESFNSSLRWTIGVLYTAVIAMLLNLIVRRFT